MLDGLLSLLVIFALRFTTKLVCGSDTAKVLDRSRFPQDIVQILRMGGSELLPLAVWNVLDRRERLASGCVEV